MVSLAETGPGEVGDGELGRWLISHRREMDQAQSRWLLALAEFDSKGLWARDGQLTCVAWLRWKLKVASSTAYEWLHVSHQLRQRAVLAEAYSAGRVSYSAVRAMSHMEDPDPETDAALVRLAEERTVREVEYAVRHYNQIKDQERPPADPEFKRCLRVRPLGDGHVRVELTVLEIESEEILAAVSATEAVRRRSSREEDRGRQGERPGDCSREEDRGRQGERHSDSSREEDRGRQGERHGDSSRGEDQAGSAETGTASPGGDDQSEGPAGSSREDDPGAGGPFGAGYGDEAAPGVEADGSSREDDSGGEDAAKRRQQVTRVDGFMDLCRLALAHVDDGHAAGDDRYMVHVVGREGELTTLDGQPIPAEVAEQICCDASVVAHTVDDTGEPLQLGRRTKEWSTAQRRAIAVRDGGGCRYPGCEHRIVDVHHRTWWSQGGLTDVANGLTTCRRHHQLLHHGFSTQERADGGIDFLRPDGTILGTTYPVRQLAYAA